MLIKHNSQERLQIRK